MRSDSLKTQRRTTEPDYHCPADTPALPGAPPAAHPAEKIVLIRGNEAELLLGDAGFRAAWTDLADFCPWMTAWQSFEYAKAWLSVYRDTYEPLFVAQYASPGVLAGLFPLAIRRNDGALVHVGAHQAEYQGWLARPAASDRFVEQALGALRQAFPRARLGFQFLPPGTPVGWCATTTLRVVLQAHSRPLLTLGPEGGVEKSLKKKHTRNRINRLQRIAPLRFVELQSREEFERVIDTVADFCDLRQGALNASLPFRDDPHKREFWLRLMETPGLAHASVLLLGDSVIAAHVGPINRTSVALGVIAHSPFVADSSPGKLLVLMLARTLGIQGFQDLDLTPEGTYKERIADHADEVHSLIVHFQWSEYLKSRAVVQFRDRAGRALGEDGLSRLRRLRQVLATGWRGHAGKPLSAPQKIFALPGRKDLVIALPSLRFNVNNVADLLRYRPQGRGDRSQGHFLSHALERLEAGDRAYTLVRDGALQYCGWMGAVPKQASGILPDEIAASPGACFLSEDILRPAAADPHVRAAALAQRLHDAITQSADGPIVAALAADDRESAQTLMSHGFRAARTVAT